jgi:23S rRNA (adenine2030-N6)-methyltransferase
VNYHHIYHAGNFADLLKHISLCFCLEKLNEKDTPYFVIDTHSGIAKYDLNSEESIITSEASNGIKKLVEKKEIYSFLPTSFLSSLAKINNCQISELSSKIRFYAGSPYFAANSMRKIDRSIFAELNHQDFKELKKNLNFDKNIFLLKEDGFNLTKAKLPMIEKRGLILIDPAFEKDQSKISPDYQKIILSLQNAFKRFRNGIYLIWYPIIESDLEVVKKFEEEILSMNWGNILKIKIDIGKISDQNSAKNNSEIEAKIMQKNSSKMHCCGVFIINPAWQIDEKIKLAFSKILPIIQNNNSAFFDYQNYSQELNKRSV